VFGDPAVYRRRQRRRAIIAWSIGAVSVLLLVLSVVLGAAAENEAEPERQNPFGYAMSSEQFDELDYGLSLGAFLDDLEKTGLPEDRTKGRYVQLFPPHTDEVSCSYWEISDELEEVARVCFDEGGRLVEKLQRDAGEEAFGVTV
jgi:hypothetical protein